MHSLHAWRQWSADINKFSWSSHVSQCSPPCLRIISAASLSDPNNWSFTSVYPPYFQSTVCVKHIHKAFDYLYFRYKLHSESIRIFQERRTFFHVPFTIKLNFPFFFYQIFLEHVCEMNDPTLPSDKYPLDCGSHNECMVLNWWQEHCRNDEWLDNRHACRHPSQMPNSK
jgi:hypothetical protein